MRQSLLALLPVAALLVAGVVVPTAGADHCEQKITIYSRRAIVETPPPPSIHATASSCMHVAGATQNDAFLVPGTEQVLVRFYADLGPSVPTLPVVLDGLGFANQTFQVHRTPSLHGFHVYQMANFESLPANSTGQGTLTATVLVPGGSFSVTYRTL